MPDLPLQHAPEPDTAAEAVVRRSGWRSWLMYAVAIALLGGCIGLATRNMSSEVWEHVRHASGRDVTGMLGLVLGSVLLNGWIFWAVVKPFEPGPKRIGTGEMTALIGATCLLNYLPMRAGMIGRAAYLKRQYHVSYRASALMMALIAAGTMAIYAALVGLTLWRKQLDAVWWASLLGSIVVMGLAAVPVSRWVSQWIARESSAWFGEHGPAAMGGAMGLMAVRAADVAMVAGRLWIAGRIIGAPIGYPAALTMASAGTFVTLVTPLPNGLGLREGLYGLMAEVGVGSGAMAGGSMGVAIGLVDRAAEAAVFIAAGLVSLAWLHRKRR